MRFLPIILLWCMVVGAAFAVFSSFLSGLGMFYHPNSDGAHLQSFYGMFWMVVLCVLLFLAFLIMSKRDQWKVWGQAGVLVAFGVGVFGIERGYVALHPQPSHFLMLFNGTYYSLPRAYSPRVVADRVEVDQISKSVCVADLSPNSGSACEARGDRPRTALISLSQTPIARDYLIANVLDAKDVPFKGDTIGPLPEGVGKMVDGVLVLKHEGAVLMMELDPARQVKRAVWCRDGVLGCHGHSRTAHGHLSFPSVGKAEVDKARWDAEEARVDALFAAWRCEERSCAGVYQGGATEAFE